MLTFGSFGRQANRQDYAVYTIGNGSFLRAKPAAAGDVVIGQAVEFRYWASPLNAAIMDTSITATHYVLFYLDGTTLKVDRGQYLPGGVANNGTVRLTGGVSTQVLAENVTTLQFSHTATKCAGRRQWLCSFGYDASRPNRQQDDCGKDGHAAAECTGEKPRLIIRIY